LGCRGFQLLPLLQQLGGRRLLHPQCLKVMKKEAVHRGAKGGILAVAQVAGYGLLGKVMGWFGGRYATLLGKERR
jgi:hypothetical protein